HPPPALREGGAPPVSGGELGLGGASRGGGRGQPRGPAGRQRCARLEKAAARGFPTGVAAAGLQRCRWLALLGHRSSSLVDHRGLRTSLARCARSAGVAMILVTSACTSSPLTGSTSIPSFSPSPRQAGSLIVAPQARRMSASRSGAIPGGARDGRDIPNFANTTSMIWRSSP